MERKGSERNRIKLYLHWFFKQHTLYAQNTTNSKNTLGIDVSTCLSISLYLSHFKSRLMYRIFV